MLQTAATSEKPKPRLSPEMEELDQMYRIYYRDCVRIDEDRDPLLHQCKLQIGYVIKEFLRHISAEKRYKRQEIGQLLKNLLALHHKTVNLSRNVAEEFARTLDLFFQAADLIEIENPERKPNWSTLIPQLKSMCSSLVETDPEETLTNLVPTMDQFNKIELLGYGGFATANHVVYKPANIQCCMKITNRTKLVVAPSTEEAFIERLIASIVHHPFVVHFIAGYTAKNAYISLMHLYSGTDLSNVLDYYGKLQQKDVQIIMAQLILALEYLHHCGFIHRDIKPSNLLIEKNGHIFLTDFDLSRTCMGHYLKQAMPIYFSRTANEFKLFQHSGTQPFMSPEVYNNDNIEQLFGRASDWWSVGVSLYKITTGHVLGISPVDPNFLQNFEKLKSSDGERLKNEIDFMAKCFVVNPEQRIGSGSYKEIVDHPFLRKLDLNNLWRKNKFTIDPKFEETIGEYRKNTGIDQMHPEVKLDWRINDIMPFECVYDLAPPQQHKPLFTYFSPKFKNLINRLKDTSMKFDDSSETLVNFDTPPTQRVDYDKEAQIEPMMDFPVKVQDATTKDITIERRRRLKMFWIDGFDIERVMAKSGKQCFIVSRVKLNTSVGDALIQYDVIESVNGRPVLGLKSLPLEGQKITLSVSLSNPFRMINEKQDLLPLLNKSTDANASLLRISKTSPFGNRYGLGIESRQLWSSAAKAYKTIHLVCYANTNSTKNLVFIGDILLQVGKDDASTATNEAIRVILRDCTDETLNIRIKETSTLRNM